MTEKEMNALTEQSLATAFIGIERKGLVFSVEEKEIIHKFIFANIAQVNPKDLQAIIDSAISITTPKPQPTQLERFE